jgi:GNAT superfamily N-acetyltransferase
MIRLGTPADREIVRLCANQTDPKENSEFNPGMYDEAVKNDQVLVEPKSGSFLNFYPCKRKPHVSIYNLFVHRDYRGQGIGKALTEKLIEMYPNRPFIAKCPEGAKSNTFWVKMRFKKIRYDAPEGKRQVGLNIYQYN